MRSDGFKPPKVNVLAIPVTSTVLKVAVFCPTPDKIAENIAANNEGSKKLKITLFESITPF